MQTEMKKLLAIFLAFVLCILQVPFAFAADSKLTASLNTVSGFPGDSVEMNIELSGNTGLTSLKFDLGFDDTVLALTGVEFNSAFGSLVSAVEPYTNPQTISFISPFSAVNENGVFATLTFKISENATPGYNAQVTLTAIPDDIIDGSDNVVPIELKNAFVLVDGEAVVTPTEDLILTEKEDGTLSVDGYKGNDTKIVIADEYEINGTKKKITEIGDSAFEGNKVITSVIIPECVKKIGDYAFYDCDNLKEATVLGKDTVIGEKALGYHYVSRKEDGVNEGFVIKGYGNSLVKAYAEGDENIAFSEIQEECTHKNARSGKGKEPTCFVPGLTAGFFCPDCNCWIVPQKEIPAKHTFGKWTVNTNTRTHECVLCHTTETENIINNIMTERDTVIDYDNSVVFGCVRGAADINDLIFVPSTVGVTADRKKGSFFGTGSVVTAYSSGKLVGEFSVVITGDLDGDSICDVIDISLAEKYMNGQGYPNKCQIYAANGCISDEIDITSYQNTVNTVLNS